MPPPLVTTPATLIPAACTRETFEAAGGEVRAEISRVPGGSGRLNESMSPHWGVLEPAKDAVVLGASKGGGVWRGSQPREVARWRRGSPAP